MKNYILDGKGEDRYIQKVIKNTDGTLTVVFADGRVFKNISLCEDNISKIIAVQEEQAKKGIENYRVFAKKESAAKAGVVASGIGAFAISAGATFIPAVQTAISSQDSFVIAAGIGIITVLGMIPAYAKFRKEKSKVDELNKIRYRNQHLQELESFRDYPNAMSGVRPTVAKWMRREKNPFCILNIGEYELDDLVQMMTNIDVEKAYDFTYNKGKSRSR